MTEKVTLPKLTIDGVSAIYLDIEDLCESFKTEIVDYTSEEKRTLDTSISFIEMTEKELEALPEFEGF